MHHNVPHLAVAIYLFAARCVVPQALSRQSDIVLSCISNFVDSAVVTAGAVYCAVTSVGGFGNGWFSPVKVSGAVFTPMLLSPLFW